MYNDLVILIYVFCCWRFSVSKLTNQKNLLHYAMFLLSTLGRQQSAVSPSEKKQKIQSSIIGGVFSTDVIHLDFKQSFKSAIDMAKPAKKATGGKKKKKKVSGPPGAINPEYLQHVRAPPAQTDGKSSTLQSTIITGDVSSLKRLVAHYDYRRDLAKVDAHGATLVHTAVRQNDMPALKALLDYKAIDLDAREIPLVGGHGVLHLACSENKPLIVDMLLQNSANPNLKSDSAIGETPLMICCKLGHVKCAELLLKHGAAFDILDNFGNNASFWAYRHGNAGMARDLQLPPSRTPTPAEFLAIQMQRIPGFKLPKVKIKQKAGKKQDGGKKKK